MGAFIEGLTSVASGWQGVFTGTQQMGRTLLYVCTSTGFARHPLSLVIISRVMTTRVITTHTSVDRLGRWVTSCLRLLKQGPTLRYSHVK